MGDYVRWATPGFEGAEDSAKGALFLALNRNKRSVRLDLKSEAGREVLLRLARDARRPARVLPAGRARPPRRRLGRPARGQPRARLLRDLRLREDGPRVGRSGHDLNYLGLNGLLALTGERDGPPVQSGGQIADLGGGALMAAFGILAALRHRDATGEGQVVDVSMFDGALSWLAMVAGRVFAAGERPRRGGEALGGSLVCYRPYACADGWVTLGALEPKFWAAWCRGVGREDLIERQFERARLGDARRGRGALRRSHARRVGGLRGRSTTAAWSRCSSSRRRWPPSSCARGRWSSPSSSPAPARCGASASR